MWAAACPWGFPVPGSACTPLWTALPGARGPGWHRAEVCHSGTALSGSGRPGSWHCHKKDTQSDPCSHNTTTLVSVKKSNPATACHSKAQAEENSDKSKRNMTSFFLTCKHLSKRSELEMQFCQTAFFYAVSLNWKIMWKVALWNPLRFLSQGSYLLLPEVFLTIKKWRKSYLGNSLAVQWWGFRLPVQGVQDWSLVGKLRSHTLWGQKSKM